MISSIISCLRVFLLWAVVAVFILIPYAVSQHNLRFPNRIVNSYSRVYSWNGSEWNKTRPAYSYKAMTLRKLLRDAFFNMFGELFFDEFDPGTAHLSDFKQKVLISSLVTDSHKPWECSEALSEDDETSTPCTDYVSISLFL